MKKQKNIYINMEKFLMVQKASATEKENHNCINGVYIEDIENRRYYVSTNGYILLSTSEEIYGDKLEKPLLFYPIKNLKSDFSLKIMNLLNIDENYYIAKNSKQIIALKINEGKFPEWKNVFPKKETKKAKEYCLFDTKYLKLLKEFLGKEHYLQTPIMEDNKSPALFEHGEDKAVLMPIRIR